MISVVIPVYNAAKHLSTLLSTLNRQTLKHELIIIDSGSTDNTTDILDAYKIKYYSIDNFSFNHGATRNLGLSLASFENVIMLTQDALPSDDDVLNILNDRLNSDPRIAVAYGRQLPYPEADILSTYARLANYPGDSSIRTMADIPKLGIRTCHSSNSFAAYKKDLLMSVGGFPSNTILGEDVVVAARFLKAGYSVAYCSESKVWHSHNYSAKEEFKRYFDIGAFHQQEEELLRTFQRAESQGIKFVIDEWKYLFNNRSLSILPEQIIRTTLKYIGYRLGRSNKNLPTGLRKKLSMHPIFWDQL